MYWFSFLSISKNIGFMFSAMSFSVNEKNYCGNHQFLSVNERQQHNRNNSLRHVIMWSYIFLLHLLELLWREEGWSSSEKTLTSEWFSRCQVLGYTGQRPALVNKVWWGESLSFSQSPPLPALMTLQTRPGYIRLWKTLPKKAKKQTNKQNNPHKKKNSRY